VSTRILVGTYTDLPPPYTVRGEGILAYELDGVILSGPVVLARPANPSYLALSPRGNRVYAVGETVDGEEGSVSAFSFGAGRLDLLGSSGTRGVGPCHLAASPDGRFVLVAHYGSGSVTVLAVGESGLGPVTDVAPHDRLASGNGVVPRAHMIAFDPLTGDVLVPDLGLDVVVVYRLTDNGELVERTSSRVELPAGSGPRHLAFHPNGSDLFVVNELSSTVAVLRREPAGFVLANVVSTLWAPDEAGRAAAVRVSADGSHVFVTNRAAGGGSVAMLRHLELESAVELVHVAPSGGTTPRDCLPLSDGRHLVVANEDADLLELFEIDARGGTMGRVADVRAGTPACLLLA
jgi:6-phosphogluconolactonase